MLDNIRDKSRPIGLRAEDPHIYELEDMFAFCNNHKAVYIYGAAYKQVMMYKLLMNSKNSHVKGLVVTRDAEKYTDLECDVYQIDDVINEDGVGIILGLNDGYYRQIIPYFRTIGFKDYFVPTEWNKRTIAEKMTPRDPDYNSFEISLTDHCNMSCQMCDHFAQLSEEWFVNLDVLDKDLERMSQLCDGKCAVITLLGGEPLLHPDVIKCFEITRKHFPTCPLVLLTNGILLLKRENDEKGNIWKAIRDNNVVVSITRYPIKLDYDAIKAKAKEYGVTLLLSSDIHSEVPIEEAKISYKHTFTLQKKDDNIYFPACHYFNHLGVVKDGKYYMCPVSAHSNIFNKKFGQNLELTDEDCVDIYKAKSWEDIAYFQANRIPFCCYCDIQKWGDNSVWKPSNNTIEEYT